MNEEQLTQLGGASDLPESPEAAVLECAANPHPGTPYLIRFTAPEFTSVCPVTGQPDFAHLVIDYVPADYHSDYPKRCMGGWGSTGLNVTPDGKVLPCHAAESIPHLSFDRVTERSLRDIWYKGAAFNAYRGTDWMQEPCKSCERKTVDFGGCRCQAMALAGDPAATDPVCIKSPHHVDLQARADFRQPRGHNQFATGQSATYQYIVVAAGNHLNLASLKDAADGDIDRGAIMKRAFRQAHHVFV